MKGIGRVRRTNEKKSLQTRLLRDWNREAVVKEGFPYPKILSFTDPFTSDPLITSRPCLTLTLLKRFSSTGTRSQSMRMFSRWRYLTA